MKIIATITLVLTSSLFFSICEATDKKIMSLSATSSVTAAPELARFNFLIEKRGKNLASLKSEIDAKAGRLVRLCKKLGIKTKDITAAEIHIEPRYNYNNNSFLGYRITRTISATLHDLSKYAMVIDGAVNAGITNISNISLELNQKTSLENKALTEAVKLVKNKAELLASLTNVKLGEVLNIQEGGAGIVRTEYKDVLHRSSAKAKAVFEPGLLSITKTVSITYSIN